jgi:hypothetical protein
VQSEFNLVLQKLGEASSDSMVSQIQKLFLAITKMSDDELVATYQTIDTVARNIGIASASLSSLVQDTKKAIVVQMQQKILSNMMNEDARKLRFTAVTGFKFKGEFDIMKDEFDQMDQI